MKRTGAEGAVERSGRRAAGGRVAVPAPVSGSATPAGGARAELGTSGAVRHACCWREAAARGQPVEGESVAGHVVTGRGLAPSRNLTSPRQGLCPLARRSRAFARMRVNAAVCARAPTRMPCAHAPTRMPCARAPTRVPPTRYKRSHASTSSFPVFVCTFRLPGFIKTPRGLRFSYWTPRRFADLPCFSVKTPALLVL